MLRHCLVVRVQQQIEVDGDHALSPSRADAGISSSSY
jgi:hypothetical protein